MSQALFLALTLAAGGDTPKAATPNIVFILADDLGYGDVGCYGGKIPTPHVDRLAREGMRFTDAHSGSSVCSPTRYGLLTGRYAWRTTWMKKGVLAGFDPPLIERGQVTVAEFLRRHGYTTAIIGKWHLGFGWQWPEALGRPALAEYFTARNTWDKANYPRLTGTIADGPTTRGFDYFFGNTAPNQDPFCFLEDDRVVGLAPDAHKQRYSRDKKPVALKDENILPTLVRKTTQYIEERAKDQKRFFLYVPLTSPHSPVSPSAAYKGKSGAGAIGDFLMETDGAVGAVLDALDTHRLADKTLVVFTSDNGHIAVEKTLKAIGHEPNGKLRGTKGGIYEGGHRVPYVARWPGVIAKGTASDEPICHTHLFATCADLVGKNPPPGAAEDSYSIFPVLRGTKLERPTHPHIVHQALDGTLAIRKGPWKWIEGKELFNLALDPAETRDRSADEPGRVRELKELLDEVKGR